MNENYRMMLSMEEILVELDSNYNYGNDCEIVGGGSGLPPGFRFHPTDEELITFYLASKVFHHTLVGSAGRMLQFAEVDLNRCEPWELPDAAKTGEREWYFYSQRDRKYPTGLRTNRATEGGYWKATGKDREVYSGGMVVGMKKTLVFYKGRAPRGQKTKWVMHEYRLHRDFSSRHITSISKEEWVICRTYHRSTTTGDKKNPIPLQQEAAAAAGLRCRYSFKSCISTTCSTPAPQNSNHPFPLRLAVSLENQISSHHDSLTANHDYSVTSAITIINNGSSSAAPPVIPSSSTKHPNQQDMTNDHSADYNFINSFHLSHQDCSSPWRSMTKGRFTTKAAAAGSPDDQGGVSHVDKQCKTEAADFALARLIDHHPMSSAIDVEMRRGSQLLGGLTGNNGTSSSHYYYMMSPADQHVVDEEEINAASASAEANGIPLMPPAAFDQGADASVDRQTSHSSRFLSY